MKLNYTNRSDEGAVQSYEAFRLGQPHIKCEGLAKKITTGTHYIVCPDFKPDTSGIGKLSAKEWFRRNRILGAKVKIVSSLPAGEDFEWVKPRSMELIKTVSGEPQSQMSLDIELNLRLPLDFPEFRLRNRNQKIEILFKNRLSRDHKFAIKQALEDIGAHYRFHIRDKKCGFDSVKPIKPETWGIIPVRKVSPAYPAGVKKIWEEDEHFWLDNRAKILSGDGSWENQLVNPSNKVSKCLINASVAPVNNLRNYLSIFEQVNICAPTAEYEGQFYSSLKCTEDELKQLVGTGRVRVIFPLPFHRYLPQTILAYHELQTGSALFHRGLMAVTTQDIRKRNPFFYPFTSLEEQVELLHGVTQIANELDSKESAYILKVAEHLGENWSRMSRSLHVGGGLGISQHGLFPIISELVKMQSKSKIDLWAPISYAAPEVEWAGSLGCTLLPNPHIDTTPQITEWMAHVYSGVPAKSKALPQLAYSDMVANEILCLDNDVPILEFATEFRGSEINQFRRVVGELTKHRGSKKELQQALKAYNIIAKSYAGQDRKLKKWDLKGGIVTAAVTGGSALLFPATAKITIPAWLISLFVRLGQSHLQKTELGVRFNSLLQSIPTNHKPDAVFVCNMRQRTKALNP